MALLKQSPRKKKVEKPAGKPGSRTGMTAAVVAVLDSMNTALVRFKIKDLEPLMPKKYRDHRAIRNAVYFLRNAWTSTETIDLTLAGDPHQVAVFREDDGWLYVNYSLLTVKKIPSAL